MVNDMRLGLIFRILQISIFSYVVGYSIIAQKSYQQYDEVQGASTIKIKGTAYMRDGNSISVYDANDLIVPPVMEGAFFINTRFHTTIQQQNQVCSVSIDNSTTSGQTCDQGCINGQATLNGIMTGTCGRLNGTTKYSTRFCNIKTWCPLEDDPKADPSNILNGTDAFSIFIRTNIQFPLFGITISSGKLPEKGKSLFLLSDILTGMDFDSIKSKGGVILAKAAYNCDEDSEVDNCHPEWDFSQIDEGTGFNYRTATYVGIDQKQRILKKLYGVRVVVVLYGKAGKFYIVNLLVALGAGLGLLGVASVTADFLLQTCWPRREKFLHDKYTTVDLEVESKAQMLHISPLKNDTKDHYKMLPQPPEQVPGSPIDNPLLVAIDEKKEGKIVNSAPTPERATAAGKVDADSEGGVDL